MGRKRKATDVGKMANKGKTPLSEKLKGEEKEHAETAQTVLVSKDVENHTHSPSNDQPPEPVSNTEHVVEIENLVEKEKEEPNCCQQVGSVPGLDERNMEQKVAMTTNADLSSELSYKSMYISSQKQIEDLMAENCRLSMQLEFARGKIEVYEKVTNATRTIKDVILIDSIVGKTQENAIGNSNSDPGADNQKASQEKNDSKNASNIANEQMKVPRQRRKRC
ncbi:hypothetical protein F511_21701 [Dorcoceras hygrometricum]|uniref:Uncharacterized protein n=1 Tax=Dorcoceras hygrometricum TaxID=472368 RepID=A0A2Z7A9X6_9LAMI|nr:hypothetical protein F511_21701 [Dorcoceras hygrometricum]